LRAGDSIGWPAGYCHRNLGFDSLSPPYGLAADNYNDFRDCRLMREICCSISSGEK
jgi:hypothetical protein